MNDVQFVTDAEGRKTAALVPMPLYEAFQEFMEEQSLARAAVEALKDEERIPWGKALHQALKYLSERHFVPSVPAGRR